MPVRMRGYMMRIIRRLRDVAILCVLVAFPLAATASANPLEAEQTDRLNYVTYAAGVALVAAIVSGIILVETDESDSP